MVGVTGVNFWASENLSGRVHFEGYSPEWRVLSKLSVQPCECNASFQYNCKGVNFAGYQSKHTDLRERRKNKTKRH